MQPTVLMTTLSNYPKEGLPSYAHPGDSGMDLYAAVSGPVVISTRPQAIPTGIKMSIPVGYEGQVRPRSGLALREGLIVVNSPGTIDSQFRGEIMVVLACLGRQTADGAVIAHTLTVHPGDRVAQLVISPVVTPTVIHVREDELSSTVRGANGLGSTGLNDSGAKR
jgi:dUTP pyrophosphatase